MMMHSLRPHLMEGHMAIYTYVLHHRDNTIDKWFLETLGVWVSALNDCDYCVEHHFAGLKRLLNDDKKSDQIRTAIISPVESRRHYFDASEKPFSYLYHSWWVTLVALGHAVSR